MTSDDPLRIYRFLEVSAEELLNAQSTSELPIRAQLNREPSRLERLLIDRSGLLCSEHVVMLVANLDEQTNMKAVMLGMINTVDGVAVTAGRHLEGVDSQKKIMDRVVAELNQQIEENT